MAQQLPLIETRLPAQLGENRTGARRKRRSSSGKTLAVVPDRPGEFLEIPAADWHIDHHTKQVGLAGVAAARRALADAVRRTAA